LVHPEDQAYAALPKLYWRNTAAALATGLLQDVPVPQQGEYDEEFIPSPCTVSPTPVVEYPNWDLPQDLQLTVRSRMVMGDLGGMYIFLCRRCPELPYAHRYDCWDGADEGLEESARGHVAVSIPHGPGGLGTATVHPIGRITTMLLFLPVGSA
jgi:hypothetical protein